MPAESTKVIFARVPSPLHDRVAAIAAASGIRMSDVVAIALRDFTDRLGPRDRIALAVSHVEG